MCRSWRANCRLFNGLGERTPSWAWVQRSVSSSTRVCTYDRAGEGWSDGTSGARDGHELSSDLQGLLAAAHVPGPYVLAGHSIGGIYALLYAAQYPKQVAGLALIDSSTPYQFDLPGYSSFYRLFRRVYAVLPSLARAGLMRLGTGTSFAGLPSQERNARAFAASPRELGLITSISRSCRGCSTRQRRSRASEEGPSPS